MKVSAVPHYGTEKKATVADALVSDGHKDFGTLLNVIKAGAPQPDSASASFTEVKQELPNAAFEDSEKKSEEATALLPLFAEGTSETEKAEMEAVFSALSGMALPIETGSLEAYLADEDSQTIVLKRLALLLESRDTELKHDGFKVLQALLSVAENTLAKLASEESPAASTSRQISELLDKLKTVQQKPPALPMLDRLFQIKPLLVPDVLGSKAEAMGQAGKTDGTAPQPSDFHPAPLLFRAEVESAAKAAESTVRPAVPQLPEREIQQLLNRSHFGQANGTNRLLVKLYPEQLGTVRLEIVQKDGIFTAKILASTSHGKELLDASVHQLRQAFMQQQLPVERIEIAQALQTADRQPKQQSSHQPFQEQQQQQQQEEQNEEFIEFFMNVEV